MFPVHTGINRHYDWLKSELGYVPCTHRDKPDVDNE